MGDQSQSLSIHQENSPSRSSFNKRRERAHRILDAASTLILRWGYNKTTIDDIARGAGVAKGTIYLHWKTREALFASLGHREMLLFTQEFRQRISADPMGGTLRGIVKHSALAILKRPLLKALLLRDREVLGKMAQSEFTKASYIEIAEGFQAYLESLRQHDLIRSDLSLQAQVHIVGAVYAGFFLDHPIVPKELALPDEELIELMAETVQRTLGTDRAIPVGEMEAVTQTYLETVDHLIALTEEQFQQELRGPA
jgi:AcrR family transcriptional regulator